MRDSGLLHSMEVACCNGEALSATLTQEFFSQFPFARLINSYGPTETCVGVTAHIMHSAEYGDGVSVGVPGTGTSLFLQECDCEQGRIKGELVIAGRQVGDGYVSPDGTSVKSFFDLPGYDEPRPAYVTGDLFRLERDQRLVFVGRKDRQVKYRGIRIELGEIERAYLNTGECTDAAAIILNSSEDVSRQLLVAFVTPKSAPIEEIQRQVCVELPKEITPDTIIALNSIPSTPNGKRDVDALFQLASNRISGWKGGSPTADNAEERFQEASAILLRCLQIVLGKSIEPTTIVDVTELDSLDRLRLEIWVADFGYHLDITNMLDTHLNMETIARLLTPIPREAPPASRLINLSSIQDDVTALFSRLMQAKQDIILFQSSLSGLRVSDPEEFARIILENIRRLSKSKTVLIPAYTLTYSDSRRYHHERSKPETGSIAEALWSELSPLRTRHPVYSFFVLGRSAPQVVSKDYGAAFPFGSGSIFEWLSNESVICSLLGTWSLTTTHRYESIAGVPYHRFLALPGSADFGEGEITVSPPVYARDIASEPEAEIFGTDLGKLSELLLDATERYHIGGLSSTVFDLGLAEQRIVAALKRDPLALISAEKLRMAKMYLHRSDLTP